MKNSKRILELKQQVFKANQDLVTSGLVILTWGNVSGYDEETGYVAIKPSGVSYDTMRTEDIVIVDLEGNKIEGDYSPSSDTPTHLEIYKAFKGVNAVVHTHSKWATSWAQAGLDIPCLGTTHADNFYGRIPCTRSMTDGEISSAYEQKTGSVIIETFKERGINPLEVSAAIVKNHGPFSWGRSIEKAVVNAVVMEYVAEMAFCSLQMNHDTAMQQSLLDKHFLRKHGKNAYYGQTK